MNHTFDMSYTKFITLKFATIKQFLLVWVIFAMTAPVTARGAAGQPCEACDDCVPHFAIKTNLLHDALLTPDLGIEVNIGRRFSISAEGVWAWWSRDSRHRYWRVYGGWGELRVWLGDAPLRRALTGHHLGVYGSVHSFDFEFGGKGWLAPGLTGGAGLSYGYSLRIAPRLNLDFSVRAGYWQGDVTTYKPQCGVYTCVSHDRRRYFGPTSLEVTLVWFPGRSSTNRPDYNR